MHWGKLFVTVLVLCPAAALADVPAPAAGSPPPATVGAAVGAAVTAAQDSIAVLEAQARATTDPEAAYLIAVQVEQAKRNLLRDVLAAQLESARRDGQVRQAAELEAALARLAATPEPVPQPRPTPDLTPAGR